MKKTIVIGGGPGGYVCALAAQSKGAGVTLIEKTELGGTCLNRGCIPSKIMKESSARLQETTDLSSYGINIEGDVTIDMTLVQERKNRIVASQIQGIKNLLTSKGITVINGTASVKSTDTIEILKNDHTTTTRTFDRLVIATGSRPRPLETIAFDHKQILSSDDLLRLDKVPESIVIVGGGVIGCEFAGILADFGTKVTIIEGLSRLLPLPSVDMEISRLLLREMKKRKIKVICDAQVKSVSRNGSGLAIDLETSRFTDNPSPKPLKETQIQTSMAAICIGREAILPEGLCDVLDIRTDPNGWIQVDENLKTNVENVFAIGDILGPEKMMLAHVASHEGMIAAANLCGENQAMSYEAVPNAVFTSPQIGCVGLSEAQTQNLPVEIETATVNYRNIGKAHAIGKIEGLAKVIYNKNDLKILGVHIAGAQATEILAEAGLAVKNGLTLHQVADTIHAHPTLSEIMAEVTLKASGTPIHG